jgi:hypothetical protein
MDPLLDTDASGYGTPATGRWPKPRRRGNPKRKHRPGPLVRRPHGQGVRTTCSCGKRVSSTGNDLTLWRAFDKHVKRAEQA